MELLEQFEVMDFLHHRQRDIWILKLLVGAVVGAAVPLLAYRLGGDPAEGARVLLTFTTDSIVFIELATVFLFQ